MKRMTYEGKIVEIIENHTDVINRYRFKKLIEPMIYGVAITDEQKSKIAKAIANFFKECRENGCEYNLKGFTFRTLYSNGKEIRSWIEYIGRELDANEMFNMQYLIPVYYIKDV